LTSSICVAWLKFLIESTATETAIIIDCLARIFQTTLKLAPMSHHHHRLPRSLDYELFPGRW
jgi:hypothetical protein